MTMGGKRAWSKGRTLPCAPLFLYHGALTYLAKLFTHKSEEGFYRFCSKRQKFCSFARHTLTINTTPIPSIAMHISSLLDPFHVHFKFLSTPKYHYSQKCPEVHMEWVQQWRYMHPHHHHRLNAFLMNISILPHAKTKRWSIEQQGWANFYINIRKCIPIVGKSTLIKDKLRSKWCCWVLVLCCTIASRVHVVESY